MGRVADIWNSFTGAEKRNIAVYIGGIMMYKLGLEFFNGSITTLATDRFKRNPHLPKAPWWRCFPLALMTAILLIVDGATGGKIKPASAKSPIYGNWNPNLIFVVWTLSGISYGMVELIRRVIPADIVGGNVSKLRRMDATVHIFYEVAGTAGAFASSSAISRFGNNYSFFLTPVFFTFAGGIWLLISTLNFKSQKAIQEELEQSGLAGVEGKSSSNYFVQIFHGVLHFGESVWVGAKLVLGNRRFIWLVPAYSVALYMHRFLESGLAPAFAKRILGTSAWSQIIVGGSNFGELLGAATVLILSDVVTTPLPWLRLDAIALNLVWILPTFAIKAQKNVTWAWKVAGCFIPISFGWAAGDVSLAAYIQSALSDSSFSHAHVSALGAVMAFLYSTYIVLNAVLSYLLGKVFDREFEKQKSILTALKTVGGVQFSVACGIILISTFIPQGAFAINPKALGGIGAPTKPAAPESEDADSVDDLKKEKIHDADAEKAQVSHA